MLIEINCAEKLRKGNAFLEVNYFLVKHCAFIFGLGLFQENVPNMVTSTEAG